jgi:hypothetical protein
MLVKREAVHLAEVAYLTHAHDHRLEKAVESAKHLLGRDFDEIPRSDRALDGFEQGVLAYARLAAEDERVVDLHLRVLYPVREPIDDVPCVFAKNCVDVIEPRLDISPCRRARWRAAGTG